jgi:hypothetical protein
MYLKMSSRIRHESFHSEQTEFINTGQSTEKENYRSREIIETNQPSMFFGPFSSYKTANEATHPYFERL